MMISALMLKKQSHTGLKESSMKKKIKDLTFQEMAQFCLNGNALCSRCKYMTKNNQCKFIDPEYADEEIELVNHQDIF